MGNATETVRCMAATIADDRLVLTDLRTRRIEPDAPLYDGPKIAEGWGLFAAMDDSITLMLILKNRNRAGKFHFFLRGPDGTWRHGPDETPDNTAPWFDHLEPLWRQERQPTPATPEDLNLRLEIFEALWQMKAWPQKMARDLTSSFGNTQADSRFATYQRALDEEGQIFVLDDDFVKHGYHDRIAVPRDQGILHALSFDTLTTGVIARGPEGVYIPLANSRRRDVSAFFLPQERRVVGASEKWGNDPRRLLLMVARFLLGMVVFRDYVHDYTNAPVQSFGLISHEYHIGHYLWNELSAIEQVIDADALAPINDIYLCDNQPEHFGRIEQLYPEWPGAVHRETSAVDWLRKTFEDGQSVFKPGSTFIPESLAIKICQIAWTAEDRFVAQLDASAAALGGDAVRIVIGLRTENRCWENQSAGYIALAKRLLAAGRKVIFVFDGHNSGASGAKIFSANEIKRARKKKTDEELGTIQAERRIVQDVETGLKTQIAAGEVACHSTIELPVSCSIVAVDWAGFFLAHWGAGMAKYKWVCNAQGIVFTSCGARVKNDFFIYDLTSNRENAVRTHYLDQSIVRDAEISADMDKALGGRLYSENFEIDPSVFAEECEKLLTSVYKEKAV